MAQIIYIGALYIKMQLHKTLEKSLSVLIMPFIKANTHICKQQNIKCIDCLINKHATRTDLKIRLWILL